jgi:hypothetical protein
MLDDIHRTICWTNSIGQYVGRYPQDNMLDDIHRTICWTISIGQYVGRYPQDNMLDDIHRTICWTISLGQYVGTISIGQHVGRIPQQFLTRIQCDLASAVQRMNTPFYWPSGHGTMNLIILINAVSSGRNGVHINTYQYRKRNRRFNLKLRV